jgi:hypothetical protein
LGAVDLGEHPRQDFPQVFPGLRRAGRFGRQHNLDAGDDAHQVGKFRHVLGDEIDTLARQIGADDDDLLSLFRISGCPVGEGIGLHQGDAGWVGEQPLDVIERSGALRAVRCEAFGAQALQQAGAERAKIGAGLAARIDVLGRGGASERDASDNSDCDGGNPDQTLHGSILCLPLEHDKKRCAPKFFLHAYLRV